jgi:glycine cleavage system aminomethyltransferase T
VNPFELGLERLVSFDARAFTGREALHDARWRDPARRLVGLTGFAPRDAASLAHHPRAEVTSRVRSPSLGGELALGFAWRVRPRRLG